MRNTKEFSIYESSDDELIKNLCIELRYVGCFDKEFPEGKNAVFHTLQVKNISEELLSRNIDPLPRLKQLTHETQWLMVDLYKDCLKFPEVVPFVKLLNGQPRIELTRQKERERKDALAKRRKEFEPKADILFKIIENYASINKKQELNDALTNHHLRFVISELDQIKHKFSSNEKKFVEELFWEIF